MNVMRAFWDRLQFRSAKSKRLKAKRTLRGIAVSALDPLNHYFYLGAYEGRDPHPLFDSDWYIERYPDVPANGVNPLYHYLWFGGVEGRQPSPYFDGEYYLAQNPDIAAAKINPLVHYLQFGDGEGRNPSPFFDTKWYVAQYPDVTGSELNPLVHFVTIGASKKYKPHPLFDTDWYLRRYPEAAAPEVNPLAHFIIEGSSKNYDPSPLFDASWYISRNPDVAVAGRAPLDHYLRSGAAEGRDPSPLFSTKWYLSQSGDLNGANPLIHFLETGASKNYHPNPLFDIDWYLNRNPDVAASAVNPLVHYRKWGAYEGRDPSPLFDSDWYLHKYSDVIDKNTDPLTDYIRQGAKEGRLPFKTPAILRGVKLAVVAHLYHGELWREIVHALKNIPIHYDIFVTIPKDNAEKLRSLVLRYHQNAYIVECDNIGRDIGAFFTVMERVLELNYDVICKIHTKKGPTEPETWRYLLLQGILGSRMLVSNILKTFQENPELWIVGPKDFYISGPEFIGANVTKICQILRDLSLDCQQPPEWGFFAGTMFWARPEIFSRLVYAVNDHFEFEADNFASDGQMAHALERIFGLLPTLHHKQIGLTNNPKLAPFGMTLEVRRAPASPREEQPHFYLERRAKELKYRLPVIREQPIGRKWAPAADAKLGVNFISPIEFINGLGVHARGNAASLEAAGITLNVICWRLGFERLKMIKVDHPSCELQPINLVQLNLDLLTPLQLLDSSHLNDIVTPERYNILMFSWELTAYLQEWIEVAERFDEIWVASSFMARGISALTKVPVRILRPTLQFPAVPIKPSRGHFGLGHDRFVFFYTADAGSVLGRKNPKALLDAYLKEFEEHEGACCLLKILYAQPDDPFIKELLFVAARRSDVVFIDRILEHDELRGLFEIIDCYVSPHRSEGLGLTILDAMAAKKPVIATAYGGVTDFVTPETAIPVDYRLVEIGEGNLPYPPGFIWADPIEESLRKAMRRLFSDRKAASSLGLAGYKKAHQLFSREQAAGEMKRELERIWNQGRPQPKERAAA